MTIEKNTILYFSGTGNSFQVARDIDAEIGDFDLCQISSLITEEKIKVESKILGIVFPVYYARLPLIVEKLVNKLEISADTYIFAVATHGGGPASVLVKLKKMLQNNGAVLNSGFLIHMPGNNICAYAPSSIEKQNKLFEKESEKVKKIADIIKERKDSKCECSKLIVDTVVDKLFIKVTDKIMDNLHSRDEKFWVNDNCTSCKLCEKICPVNNIEFNSEKPAWKHNCEMCMACIQHCPKEAIQWGDKTEARKRYRNPNLSSKKIVEN